MLNLIEIFSTFQLAVLAYVIVCILMQQDYLLSKWYDFIIWLEVKKMKWLSYPLGGCEKCLAGQIALWFWLWQNFSEYQTGNIVQTCFKHCIFIAFTILFTHLLKYVADLSKKMSRK